MNNNDAFGAAAGIGVGLFILGIVIYLAVLALAIWIGYLVTRTAVKNGVLLAMRESGNGFAPTGHAGPQPPYAPPHPGAPPHLP